MALIDYATNLKTADDPARAKAYMKLTKYFGYLPVYGPSMSDVTQGQNLLMWLLQDFPGYKWVIEVRDTIITVLNEDLAANWGFLVRAEKLDNDGKVIRLMAGELLERYGLKRQGMNEQEMAEAPKDFSGRIARQG